MFVYAVVFFLNGCPFELVSMASSLYSSQLINCRHCSLIASTSLYLEQIITVLKSTDATSTFSRRLCNTDSTWTSHHKHLPLFAGSFAHTISFNCNMLKLNHNLVSKISVFDTGGNCAGSPNNMT